MKNQLPIEQVFPQVKEHLQRNNQLLLQAPPGAGKSTWLPMQLLQSDWLQGKKILMLEPRRLAARNIAHYLASQLNEKPGETVGYAFRGEQEVSTHTRLEIVTEGLLTRKIQADPELEDIGLIIFDEFHERSIHADLGLALAIEIQQGLRDDLRLLVMSATLDEGKLTELFSGQMIRSEGRGFPVEMYYQAVDNRQIVQAVHSQISHALTAHEGNILVFLPGQKEITRVEQSLTTQLDESVIVAPLYGQLDKTKQVMAIAPPPQGKRKVVLATNIAETSLTIEGISVVIDSGLQRKAVFNLRNGVTKLTTSQICKASAIQRAGRAGRTQAGVCYRLWSQSIQDRLAEQEQPEILSSDISSLLLEVMQWGSELEDLVLLDQPTNAQQQQALDLLQAFSAVDAGKLTAYGRELASFGSHPRIANLLLHGKKWAKQVAGIDYLACQLVSLIEEGRFNQLDISVQLHAGLQHALKQRTDFWAHKVKAQKGVACDDSYIGLLLTVAFPDRIAQRRGKSHRYLLANGYGCSLREDSKLQSQSYLVVADIVESKHGDGQVFAAAPLEIELVSQFLPELIEASDKVIWDDALGKLASFRQVTCGQLVLQQKPSDTAISTEQKVAAFINEIRRKGLKILPWEKSVEQLVVRVSCVNQWDPAAGFPDMDEEALLDQLEDWLGPYLNDIKKLPELNKLSLLEVLSSRLDWQQQQLLKQLAPTHYQVPTGNRYKLRYELGKPPALSVKMQEMYGEQDTPTVCNGSMPITIELLSPAQRPLQVTQDLKNFWQGSYKEVQKEMKGRYPKHFWPDDPANSQPTNRVKSRM